MQGPGLPIAGHDVFQRMDGRGGSRPRIVAETHAAELRIHPAEHGHLWVYAECERVTVAGGGQHHQLEGRQETPVGVNDKRGVADMLAVTGGADEADAEYAVAEHRRRWL